MIKKLFLGATGIAMAVATVPMFAAFEAHVINVTATIENALSVETEAIDFGTVFPQERLEKPLNVSLSESFKAEDRVDDVEYFIRQKPKCGVTNLTGTELVVGSTQTGHIVVGDKQGTEVIEEYWIDCGVAPVQFNPQTHVYGVLPMLCPYISKHPDNSPLVGTTGAGNDGSLDSFHQPFTVSGNVITWNDASGRLAKSDNDLEDNWIIDLAVPCFGGHCAQDWASFVHSINPEADPSAYTQPIANEHKVFGCDLWIEVGGISLPGLGCKNADLMLVLDRSGSIDSGELTTLKTAAKTFVDALNPSVAGTHIGQSSFSTTGTLDLHLSSNVTDIKNAIDALVNDGFTNLKEGIELATGELDSADVHERPLVPDFLVIITDGNPNRPGETEEAGKAAATVAADAAKAAGIEIYVVGVGNQLDATFLKTIASGDSHYFDATDFSDLQAQLAKLATCE